MARTDIHRPSVITPEDYAFVCAFTYSQAAFIPGLFDLEKAELDRHMTMTGGKFSEHEHGGSCHICGAWMKDYAIFYHIPTKVYIKTGFDCARKLDFQDEDLFRKIRDRRLAAEKSAAGKLKAEGLIEERGLDLEVAFSVFRNDGFGVYANDELLDKYAELKWFENTLYAACDIIRALVKYGNISDKQWAYLSKCLDRVKTAEETLANRAQVEAERIANSKPAPLGKVVVQGKIVSQKGYPNAYGGYDNKMLVVHADGWKVWITKPSSLGDVENGTFVEFTATLKASDDDVFFVFGSRPTKASIIEENS